MKQIWNTYENMKTYEQIWKHILESIKTYDEQYQHNTQMKKRKHLKQQIIII